MKEKERWKRLKEICLVNAVWFGACNERNVNATEGIILTIENTGIWPTVSYKYCVDMAYRLALSIVSIVKNSLTIL